MSGTSPAATSPAAAKPKKPAGPKTVDMVVDAITTINDRKGASIQAIKSFILEKNPTTDPSRLKTSLKKAILKGMETGVIVRPKANESSGAALTGRFKLDKAKLAALNKEDKPKKKAVAAKKTVAKKPKKTVAKSPKSPKKALAKSPGTKKAEKPKTKSLAKKKTDAAKAAKAKPTKAKTATKTAKPKEPKTPKKPKTPKTPAKAKATKTAKR